MPDRLNILILEDQISDAELIQHFLQRSNLLFTPTVVSDRDEFVSAVDTKNFDVILADHSLPQFNSIDALNKIKEKKMDVPFILVTGTVSEEFAVDILHQGADDYILKGNLQRLPSAILRAIEKHKLNRERMIAESELKLSYQQVRELASHLQQIREEERASMAREVHDVLGQLLTAIKIDLSMLAQISPTQKEIRDKIPSILDLLNEGIATVRKIATELRPSVLDDLGLVEAIKWLNEGYQKRGNITIQFKSTADNFVLPANIAIAFFRIYQETFTNIFRHSAATKVLALLEVKEQQLSLTVSDNGKGFDTDTIGNKKTLGLLGMRERALMMGAQFAITSGSGTGTKISVSFPFKN